MVFKGERVTWNVLKVCLLVTIFSAQNMALVASLYNIKWFGALLLTWINLNLNMDK